MKIKADELRALRFCVEKCWHGRKAMELSSLEVQEVLKAWIAAGDHRQAEAAAEVLHSMRELERQQANFDRVLNLPPPSEFNS